MIDDPARYAPIAKPDLTGEEWAWITHLLALRSGHRC